MYDIDEDDYAPYPQTFSPPAHSQTLPLSLHDPFNASNISLSAISHISEPIQFYETPQFFPPQHARKAPTSAATCSVCGLVKGSLAVLKPCSHPLCSTCLTSALNIVGEKDMECAMCHAKVDDFTLCKDSPDASVTTTAESKLQRIVEEYAEIEFDSGIGLLPSNFSGREIGDINLFDDDEIFMDRAQGASTPVVGSNASFTSTRTTDRVVLRIDNVPWVCPNYHIFRSLTHSRPPTGHYTASDRCLVEASRRTCTCPFGSQGQDHEPCLCGDG